MAWLDWWRNATVAIGTKGALANGNSAFVHLGTGVLALPPGAASGTPWLVTAKHVISDPSLNQVQLRFAWHDAQPLSVCLGARLVLRDPSGAPTWIAHPTPSVDLACVSFDHVMLNEVGLAPTSGTVQLPAVLSDAQYVGSDPFAGMSVFLLGYPGALDADFLARAIARQAMVAWVSASNPKGERIVLDGNIIHGNSGGPVFTPPAGINADGTLVGGATPSFIGIVSQTRFQNLSVVSQIGAVPNVAAQNFIGIGVVEPAQRVLELLRHVTPAPAGP